MIKRFFSTIKKYPIIVTDNAWTKMNKIRKNKNLTDGGFLFSATGGGCNGFNYNLHFIENYHSIKNKPTIMENSNTKLIIDPLSEFYLIGTTIDFVQENYDRNIFESKFIFIPNNDFATSCGCGISFSPKNN